MKHMDCRQQWLDVLQDSNLSDTVTMCACFTGNCSASEYNLRLADLLTNLKSLDVPRFVHQLAT